MLAQASSSALIARAALAASPSAPYLARRHVRHALSSWGLGGGLVETAVLVASELVANAAKAAPVVASTGAGQIVLTLCYSRQALRIEVTDGSANPPLLTHVPPEAESGRGMVIVEALTSEWSYSLLPSGLGKIVCCVLPADDGTGECPGADTGLRAAS